MPFLIAAILSVLALAVVVCAGWVSVQAREFSNECSREIDWLDSTQSELKADRRE